MTPYTFSQVYIFQICLETFPYNSHQSTAWKKWRLYILPQYLANLTQPIGTQKATYIFCEIRLRTNNTLYAKFEVFITFLCIVISVFRIFEC